MSKKGISLVELLGSVVLFSVVAVIVSTVIILIMNATKRIELEQYANQTGMVLIRTLESEFDDIDPTLYTPCGTNCFILTQTGDYQYQSGSQAIEWVMFSTPKTLRVELIGLDLYINNERYVMEDFTFTDASQITVSQTGTSVYLNLSFELISENESTYPFMTSHNYTLLQPPV